MSNFFQSAPSVPQFQNVIINGNFDYWQRGTSFSSVATGTYTADRFKYVKATTGAAHTVSQSADVPTLAQSNFYSNASVLIDCTTADNAVANGDLVAYQQIVEGYNALTLFGKTCTLKFWVKATKTGTYCVSFANGTGTQNYIVEYTVNTTATWELKRVTVPFTTTASAGFASANNASLYVSWALMAGSDYRGSANSWVASAGNILYATSNQVNACDSTANDFRLAQVQLYASAADQDFIRYGYSIDKELLACQRYYEKSYAPDTDPGTATQVGRKTWVYARSGAGQDTQASERFAVTKPNPPAVTVYNPSTGTSGQFGGGGAYSGSATQIGTGAFSLTSSAPSDQDQVTCHWAASAEF